MKQNETDNVWHHKDSKKGWSDGHPDPYDSPAGDCQGVDSKNYLLESSSEPKDPVADFASFVVSRCVKCQLTFKTCGAS